jgi:hypothetical protein
VDSGLGSSRIGRGRGIADALSVAALALPRPTRQTLLAAMHVLPHGIPFVHLRWAAAGRGSMTRMANASAVRIRLSSTA